VPRTLLIHLRLEINLLFTIDMVIDDWLLVIQVPLTVTLIMRVGHWLLRRGCCRVGFCVVISMLWRCIGAMRRGGMCRVRGDLN
jgi:hypothetical protein